MKVHSQEFKEQIKELGKEIDSRITYGDKVLTSEELCSISPVTNGSILKSTMKVLEFESTIQVPQNSTITYEFGLKVNGEYEYLNYGNFIVYSSEYNEDTRTYNHICYDFMLNTMKEYKNLQNGTFPMTVREYLTNLCLDCGLTFKNSEDEFANYNQIIESDLYANLDYTYRDIFDELSQVTASSICVDINDMVEVRNITETNDEIDEEYFKDVNVKFGEKYGPVNSIVLSRSAESDNIYLPDEESIATNGLCEIKIIDNQIMNFNNRSDYLPAILEKLNGLEYYVNDFTSTGILYYELCDRYTVKIGGNTYSCVLFNDEQKITQGIVEDIYTEKPEESVTDYTKSDKTDRRINQVYIIADKQNQTIESVVSAVTEQEEKISQVTQTVGELNSKISDISDITVSAEDNDAQVELDNINQSEPIRIVVRPIRESISYLYPHDNLFPSDTLFSKNRKIRFINTKTDEVIDYELPADLLYYDSENYDEFILDYDAQSCVVNKKVGYNSDGTTYVLDNPTTIEYEYPKIELTDGNYTISLLGYDNAYLFVRLMAQNIYTTQFATRAEVRSEISQTANEINLEVSKKVNEEEIVSTINQSAEQITLTGNRFVVQADNFKLDKNGNMVCIDAKVTGEINSTTGNIGGWSINSNGLTNGTVFINSDGSSTIYTVADLIIIRGYIMGLEGFELPSAMIAHYDVNDDGRVNSQDYVILQDLIGISMN